LLSKKLKNLVLISVEFIQPPDKVSLNVRSKAGFMTLLDETPEILDVYAMLNRRIKFENLCDYGIFARLFFTTSKIEIRLHSRKN